MIRVLLFVVILGSSNWSLAATPPSVQRFDSFEQLRDMIIATIATAKRRVWLISSFMSDYDISLALYIATFRQLDVRVVLGREKLQAALSQYRYLRNKLVTVRVASGIGSTVLICDERLYRSDSDLDFLTARRSFVMRRVAQPDIRRYALALGVAHAPVHGRVYDYSRKVHKRPGYISGRLPRKTIRTRNQKLSRGQS